MITIIYITCRRNCKLEWLVDALARETNPPPIQLVIVDSILHTDHTGPRKAEIANIINGRFEYVHVPPKPTAWQGPHRITSKNYFCASNTRNTGVCYAKYDYIAFVDDLGVPSLRWLGEVKRGAQQGAIYCGAYKKVNDMIVSGGELITGDIPSSCIDHRLSVYKADISPCSGGHMYGSSFCMPLKVYLDLNGQNEACDSCAGEDYEFGIRVERAGHKIFYNKNMLIHESNVAFGEDTQNINVRYDPSLDPTECRTRLNYSGIPQFSHYLLYQAHNGPISVNPQFSLESYRNTLKFAIPDKDAVHPFTCERLDTL